MMSSQADPNSWPTTLDQREWLLFSLREPEVITRKLALDEISDLGCSAAFSDLLQAIATSDSDPSCRDSAGHLLSLVEKQPEAQALSSGFEASPQGLRALFDQASPSLRQALQNATWSIPSPELLDLWRDQLLSETVPDVLAIGLSLLGKAGVPADAAIGAAFVSSEHPQVVIAAINLLTALDRPGLAGHLTLPLHHSDLDVRFRAIRCLASVDSDRAIRFLNEAIGHDDPLVRRRAIQELRLLPSAVAEGSYVRVLGLETQPLLLARAGMALIAAPRLELPPHIYDNFLMSQGIRKHVLNILLRQLVQSIRSTGILTMPTEEYLADLKRELLGRRDDLAIALVMRDLRHEELDVRRQAFERSLPFATDPRILKSLRTRCRRETDPELLRQIQAIAGSPTESDQQSRPFPSKPDASASPEASSPSAPLDQASHHAPGKVSAADTMLKATVTAGPPADLNAAVSSGRFFQLPLREQIVLVGSISDVHHFKSSKVSLLSIIQKTTERPVLIKTLKVMETWGSAADSQVLLPLLKRPDPSILGQTLKTLAHLEYEGIVTLLNPYLRDDNLAVKAAALEAFIVCDKEGALQFLKSMLSSPVVTVRRKALSMAPLLDFAAIEPLLLSILQKDPLIDLQTQAGFLLASNPTDAGIKALYFHTHRTEGQVGSDLTDLWETTRPAAARFFDCPENQVDSHLKALLERESPAQTIPKDPHLNRKPRQTAEFASPIPTTSWSELFFGGQMLSVIGIFALCFFVWQGAEFLSGSSSAEYRREPEKPAASVSAPTRPVALSIRPSSTPAKTYSGGWVTLTGTWTPLSTTGTTTRPIAP